MAVRGRHFWRVVIFVVLLAGCADWPAFREAEGDSGTALESDLEVTPANAMPSTTEIDNVVGSAIPASPKSGQPTVGTQPEEVVLPGTGEFVGRRPSKPIGATDTGDITLNFVNADLREVIRSILGDTLRVNYVIDPNVQGTVTLQTSRPLARAAVIPTLEEVLRINGAVLVDVDGLYKIVPSDQAWRGFVAPTLGPTANSRSSGFGLQIVPLEFIAAGEMAEILRPIAPEGAILTVDPARNLLILSGTGQERTTLLEIVEMFDVDWLSGMSIALIPLRFADAKAMVDDLKTVFGGETSGPLAGLIRFVPIERLTSVLVITTQKAYLADVRAWIERFDRGGDSNEQQLFVYYVENGRAADLADVLNKIFVQVGVAKAPLTPVLAPGLQPREIRTVEPKPEAKNRPGTVQPTTAIEAMIGTNPPVPGAAVAQSGSALGLVTPVARAGVLTSRPGLGVGLAIFAPGEVRIIAEEITNSLVILATPRQYRMVEAALRKLDIVPLQVLIEVTIAEVTLNDELRYGVQWFLSEGNHEVTLSDVATGAVAQAFPGFSYLFESSNTRVVLNALDSVTDVNVISSPQLLVLDNHTARLQVGDQVPVATQEAVSVTDIEAPIVNTIELIDTGVILIVTPRVGAGGVVFMDIEQQISDVIETTTSGIDSPTIQQRQIETTVAVQSGETIALGGLIRDSTQIGDSGVPFFKDIPILGALFGATSDVRERTELLVLITPRVIRNTAEARAVTEELRSRMRGLAPLGEKLY